MTKMHTLPHILDQLCIYTYHISETYDSARINESRMQILIDRLIFADVATSQTDTVVDRKI